MSTKNHILHTARINNNCPECYASDGLEFTFSQNENENKLFSRAESTISEVLYCSNCQNTIYPVNWDDDIERVYQYHKKQAIPLKTTIRLKPLAYGLLLIDLIILLVILFIVFKN